MTTACRHRGNFFSCIVFWLAALIQSFASAATIDWTSHITGSSADHINSITTDADGNIYAVGGTSSNSWVSGGADLTLGGSGDAFVAKFSPSGAIIWSTYLGGLESDGASAVAVNTAGDIYVSGHTTSGEWLGGGYRTTVEAGDGFVAKLNGAAGGAVIWATSVGGDQSDTAYGLALDSLGNIVIGGSTRSGGMEINSSTSRSGYTDGFAAKLSPNGGLLWLAYVGGADGESINDVAIDGADNVLLVGSTHSPDWVSGGHDTTKDDESEDVFVAKLNSNGESVWSSYVGGTGTDRPGGIGIGDGNSVYVTGLTWSPNWAEGGFDVIRNGETDGFLARFTEDGDLLWSTYLGGSLNDEAYGVVADGNGHIYVVGTTGSSNNMYGGPDLTRSGEFDASVYKLTEAGALVWSTYVGGTWDEFSEDIALDNSGHLYIGGERFSPSIQIDAFLARLSNLESFNAGSLSVTLSPQGAIDLGAQWRRQGTTQWRSSGDMESNVQTGFYSVELKPLGSPYYLATTPTVTVSAGVTANVLASYTAQAGLKVNIAPQGAIASGARWGTYYNSQATYPSGETRYFPSGQQYLWFNPVQNWLPPATQQVASLMAGQLTETTVTFRPSGLLKMTITPPSAIPNGAKWRPVGSFSWRDSGTTTTLPTGLNAIEFYPISAWDTPATQDVNINFAQTTNASAAYSQHVGSLKVNLAPQKANAAGGQWRRLGTTTWLNSGATEPNIPIGSHTVEFKNTGGWFASQVANVTITRNQTTTVTGTYYYCGLNWSTYAGGTSQHEFNSMYEEDIRDVATDAQGNVYAAGSTLSSGWISGNLDTTHGGELDAFAMKLSPAGGLIWATYFGGPWDDEGYGIAVDAEKNVYVTGTTQSSGWVAGGHDTTFSGTSDAFLVKLNNSGAMQWSTYAGGTSFDYGTAVALDPTGNVIIGGETGGGGWVSGGFDTIFSGQSDGFIVKYNSLGTRQWSTFLGGTSFDGVNAAAIDAAGNIFVAGSTQSTGWISGGYDVSRSGTTDGFVFKVSPSGARGWSTYVGGTNYDICNSIAVDSAGDLVVVGQTDSDATWIPDSIHITPGGDGFVLKLTNAGARKWTSLIGSPGFDVCIGPGDDIYLTGSAYSPWVADGFDTTLNGEGDAYLARVAANGTHVWSSLVGGTGPDNGYAISATPAGVIYIAGRTQSGGWTRGGYDTTFNGTFDAFVAKIGAPPFSLRVNSDGAAAVSVAVSPADIDNAGGGTTPLVRNYNEKSTVTLTAPATAGGKNFTGWIGAVPSSNRAIVVTMSGDRTTTATYGKLLTGSLRVNLAPAEAIAAGAKWRRVGTSTWLGSGAVEAGLLIGSYQIEFSPVTNWNTPARQNITVALGQQATVAGPYSPRNSLRVTITPPEAVAAGAQWRLAGTAAWLNSGATEHNLPSGKVALEFKSIANWNSPLNTTITLLLAQTTSFNVAYAPHTGAVRVNIEPAGARDAGAQWRLAGSSQWNASGALVNNVGIGAQQIVFKPAANWSAPTTMTLTVQNKKLEELAAAYDYAGLDWTSYYGGTDMENGSAIALDASGNIYLGGLTRSLNWISGGHDTTFGGYDDAFVMKLSPAGTPIWSTYLGNSWHDDTNVLLVDPQGNLYIGGETGGPGGWVSGGYNTIFNGGFFNHAGDLDGYLVKLSSTGAHLWSTYMGGSGSSDSVNVLACDPAGNVYAGGQSNTDGWVSGGYDTIGATYYDGYITKFTANGQHIWSTFVSENLDGYGNSVGGLVVHPDGNLYVNDRGHIVKLAPDGTRLGKMQVIDTGLLALHPSGDLVAVGQNYSGSASGGYDTTHDGSYDTFIVRFKTDGARVWSSFAGGKEADMPQALAIDAQGNIFVCGKTYSDGWVYGGAKTATRAGGFLLKLNGDGGHLWSTYLGGNIGDSCASIAIDRFGNAFVIGTTTAGGWAVGGYDISFNGNADAFLARFSATRTLSIRSQGVGGVPVVCSVKDLFDRNGGGTNCDYTYPAGSIVIVTAPLMMNGKQFTGWAGAASASKLSLTVLLDTDKTITATYGGAGVEDTGWMFYE